MSTFQDWAPDAPKCGPECGPECNPECGPAPHKDDGSLPRSKLVQTAENLVVVMFVVGIASQVFSFLIYAFANTA